MKPDIMYILDYGISLPNGSDEYRRDVYQWDERQKFIERYLEITTVEKWYIHDVVTKVALPEALDMNKLLGGL